MELDGNSRSGSPAEGTSPGPRPRLWERALGHINTLKPFFERTLRPAERVATAAYLTELYDPDVGMVDVTGCYLQRDPEHVVVIIHGLGGSCDSGYMSLALRAADQLGVSALLLNCRGCDRKNSDIYHSGLTADLQAAIQSPLLAQASRISVLGYSIGGHVALCYGCREPDPRVKKIAAICSPLDLAQTADAFDRSFFNVYRGHVMDGLKEIYTASYQRRPSGVVPEQARKIRKIRDWDRQIVAPRFGFQSADHYYASQSVGPGLRAIKPEAMYVGARLDPMVGMDSVVPYLHGSGLKVVWDDRAGHLGFGPDFDLGLPGPLGLESQVLGWLVS